MQLEKNSDVVIVSKDSDFVEMILQHGVPPLLLRITCGNLTNRRLRQVFIKVFPDTLNLLQTGEWIIEIGDMDE